MSRLLASFIAILMFLLFSACSHPPKQGQGAGDDIRITILPSPDGTSLSAEFNIGESVSELSFEPANALQRKNSWTTENSDWQFDGSSISRTDGRPFRRFALHLSIDSRFFNRRYVVVDRIGSDSWTLFVPAFSPADAEAALNFAGFGKLAVVRIGDRTVPADNASLPIKSDDQLIYVGSPRHVHAGAASVVAGPEVPAWLRNHVSQVLSNVLSRATERFGVEPDSQPMVYVSSHPDPRGANWKGGAFDDGVMAVRLRGIDLSVPDGELIESIANTMAHEAVHLWIGQHFKSAVNEEQPWLHEGSTEYLADRIRMSPEDIGREAEHSLNACLLSLGDRALDGSRGFVQDKAAYDCGYAINFVSEVGSLEVGGGDIATIWREILNRAGDIGFTTKDFLSVVDDVAAHRSSTFIERLLSGDGDSRWIGLENDLQRIGIVTSARHPDSREGDALRSIFLNEILKSRCDGRYGYTTYDTHVEFDTGNRCGDSLDGNPAIVRIGDSHIISQPFESYLYAKSKCDEGADLLLWPVDGANPIRLYCDSPINSLPPLFELVEVPRLPAI